MEHGPHLCVPSYNAVVDQGFAAAIRMERKLRGLSVAGLSAWLGTSTSTIKRWEAGQCVPAPYRQEGVLRQLQREAKPPSISLGIHPGLILRIARKWAGASVREAGERSGLPATTWFHYETGASKVSLGQAKEWAQEIHPCCASAFSSDAEAHETQASPARSCLSTMAKLLDYDTRCQCDSESEFRQLRHLATCFVDLGEHSLGGQASRIATIRGKRSPVDEELLREAHLGTVWIGFKLQMDADLACSRLRTLESIVSGLSASQRGSIAVVRSIFMRHAGYEAMAEEVLRSAASSAMVMIARAWLLTRRGEHKSALAITAEWLTDSDPKTRFLTNKVAYFAYQGLRELDHAIAAGRVLWELRQSHGFWSPDLAHLRHGVAA